MENTDNTLIEMQQQLQQLKDKLENQKIVNDRILRRSFSQSASRLKLKASVPIIAGVVAILCSPAFLQMGLSLAFVIATCVMMLVCIVVTIIYNQRIPHTDRDLVSAAEDLRRFRKLNADWIKIGIPMLVVWLGFFVWELVKNSVFTGPELYGLASGLGVGLILGLLLGLKNRRHILDGAEELLAQIEELRRE